MKEKEIIPYALNAFQVSEYAERVNAVTGINYNKRPFISGYIYGLRFYANHLYRKHFIHIIRSILDTKTLKEHRPLEYEESAILYTLRDFGRLQRECHEKARTIDRLRRELSETKARHEKNEELLRNQIKDLQYWLTVIGQKNYLKVTSRRQWLALAISASREQLAAYEEQGVVSIMQEALKNRIAMYEEELINLKDE
jgi:hypothetical protein